MRFTRTGGVMLMVLVSACGPSGSGNIVTEEREVGDFDSIQVSGGIDLTLTIDQGAGASVAVIYDDNLLERIVTEVDGTTLMISSRGSFNVFGEGRRVEVTTTTLDELSASGGSDVDASGTIESVVLDASGGADVDLSALVVESMVIEASGGADLTVNVTGEIEGDASGGADVTILGDPANQRIDVSGGADVSNG